LDARRNEAVAQMLLRLVEACGCLIVLISLFIPPIQPLGAASGVGDAGLTVRVGEAEPQDPCPEVVTVYETM
jgi:hypothetical protein